MINRLCNFFISISTFYFLSCSSEKQEYFPLNSGKVWNYDVTINPGVEDKVNYKKTNFSLKKQKILFEGEEFLMQPILREDNSIYYYSRNKNGILRKGIQFNGNPNIKFEEDEKYVLKYPIELGTEWNAQSKTYLILRRYAYFDYRATTNFDINYKVSSINETIKVPAGKFRDCIKVSGNGNTTFIGDREIGAINIEIKTEDWYAPKIGLIKSIRLEKTDTELFGTSKMVQVLDDYK